MKTHLITFRHHFIIVLLLISSVANCQTILKGTILDEKKAPLIGANVAIKGSYEGASTDVNGNFSFKVEEKGKQILSVSFIGYKTSEITIDISEGENKDISLTLKEAANELNSVVVTGGSFNITDSKRMMMLKPLDIVTTPGAGADIVGAMQMLSGTQKVGESEGLYVRGGSAAETRTFMDDVLVQNPFYSGAPDVSQRSRFSSSTFLFKGTSFGKGGYSAQYGQALSSILVLNTQDIDPMPGVTVGLNAAGATVTASKEYGKFSFWNNAMYNNMKLLFSIVPQNIDWAKTPESLGDNFLLRYKPNDHSLLKIYGSIATNNSTIATVNSSDETQQTLYKITGTNYMLNVVYRLAFGKENLWVLKALGGHSNNIDNIKINTLTGSRQDVLTQGKVVLSRGIGELSNIAFGAEGQIYDYSNQYDKFNKSISNNYMASFAELEYYFTKKLAAKAGVRQEYASLNEENKISPRVTLAYKTGAYSQISGAYGNFYQLANNSYLLSNTHLSFEKATHYLVNFEYSKEGRSLRLEAYQKSYNQLVLEKAQLNGTHYYDANPYRFPSSNTNNAGFGYAKGAEFFIRDNKTFTNTDVWCSYSWIDTKRLFANYLTEATPTFVSEHNFNFVYKRGFTRLNTNVGLTYTFSSGRPYYSPTFQAYQGKSFNNLSLNASYLTSLWGNFTVIYANIDNVLGIKNVYSYRFNEDGTTITPIIPATYRSIFFGMSITFKNK
jgi:hypothetical protein